MTTSKKPRKQRRTLMNMPFHRKRRLMTARLSRDLQLKHNRKRLEIVKGDNVQVLRGEFKGVEGEVSSIDSKSGRLSVDGMTRDKADGSTIFYPIHPSKVEITKIQEKDPWRIKVMDRRRPLE